MNEDVNYLSWKTKKLIFEKAELQDIVKTLNKTYNAHIVLKNSSIKKCTLTNTFNEQSLESILLVLEATLELKIKKKGMVYEISGTACENR
ncbi:MAG: hypothetical protein DRJ10_10795 [Bacteroidetes bacterium]|nr:MAG: hypothetical protein DRJ10_10795 [Bacteroidota bacterium]